MQTLIIYDTTGQIISQLKGSNLREPEGIPFLRVDVPDGKMAVSVDVSTETVVYENLPKSLIDRMDDIEQDQADLLLNLVMGGVL